MKKKKKSLAAHVHPLKPIVIVVVTGRPVCLAAAQKIIQLDSEIDAHPSGIGIVDTRSKIR